MGPLSWQGIGPYPGDYRRAFASSDLPIPHPQRLPLRSACPEGQEYGVPTFCTSNTNRLGPIYPPAVSSPCGCRTKAANRHACHFGPGDLPGPPHLSPVPHYEVYRWFVFTAHAVQSSPLPHNACSVAYPSRVRLVGYIVPPASHTRITPRAWDGRLPMREHRVSSPETSLISG